MHVPPAFYAHSTEAEVEYFWTLRPVDLIFSALQSEIKDEYVLCKILDYLPTAEIMYLLVQIYCDGEGHYVKDLAVI